MEDHKIQINAQYSYTKRELIWVMMQTHFVFYKGLILYTAWMIFHVFVSFKTLSKPHFFIIGISIFMSLDYLLFRWLFSRRVFNMNSEEYQLVLNPDSLKVKKGNDVESKYSLSYFVKIKVTRKFIRIYFKTGQSYFIPKRAFESSEERILFIQMIKANLGSGVFKTKADILD